MKRIRTLLFLMLVVTVLGFGTLGAPASITHAPAVLADEGKDENGNNGNEGNGKEGDNKDDEKGKDEKDGKDNKGNKGNKGGGNKPGESFTPAEPYLVDVACVFDGTAEETTCTFTGVAPAESKDVGHVDLPAAEVCAEVVGGDHEYVDPDPNTRVVGYKSRGSKGIFTLVMVGNVTAGGTATYWFNTGDGVFPATGPGLVCVPTSTEAQAPATEAPDQPTATSPSTATASATTTPRANDATATGTILVQIYECAEEPAIEEYDWYGLCEPGADGVALTLSLLQESGDAPAGNGTTGVNGEFHFKGLAPGAYRLKTVDAPWCHAESDQVDEQGNLVVESGHDVTVWIFFCGQAPIE